MSDGYWNQRGQLSYTCKGEKFYTITPLPYYIKRREILLNKIEQVIHKISREKGRDLTLADFGSGDGYYCCWLAQKFPEAMIHGYDISEAMVQKAKQQADSLNLSNTKFHCGDITREEKEFDIVLILTVLQHFMDEADIHKKTAQMHEIMKRDGEIILFEATADKKNQAGKLIRRPHTFYLNAFRDNNFRLIDEEYISFPFFRMYQNSVLKFIKIFLKGSEVEKCITVNKNRWLRSMNKLAFSAGSVLDPIMHNGREGYTLFVFERG